jgi:hypothetical protein
MNDTEKDVHNIGIFGEGGKLLFKINKRFWKIMFHHHVRYKPISYRI